LPNLALEITAAILVLGCWAAILPRWRRGLELFILFTPFAGLIEAHLYPAPWAVLIKDVLFAIPAYLGFALSGELGYALSGIPRSVGTILLFFVAVILVQSFNPSGPGLLATLVGLKVWLFYVPMILLGRAYVRNRASLLRLTRLMTCLVWLPCAAGILEWMLSLAIGYQRAIGLFYGEAAAAATQGFVRFDNGLMRIPGTFAFPAQYLLYILCMFVPVLGCMALEKNARWRAIRGADLALLCVAGLMTGERGAFVMLPLLLAAFYALRRGALGLVWAGLGLIAALFLVLSVSGIDPEGLLHMESDLSQSYAVSQGSEIKDAFAWLGGGVGSDTGAARVVSEDLAPTRGFEGYYAESLAELGVVGLAVALAIQVALLLSALSVRAMIAGTDIKPYAEAAAAFIALALVYNYKGPVVRLDPANMLYWLFAGMLFSLPQAIAVEGRDQPIFFDALTFPQSSASAVARLRSTQI